MMETTASDRHNARHNLAKQIVPLLTEFAATYFNDPARPNFAYSPLGLAIKTVMIVLDSYSEMKEDE